MSEPPRPKLEELMDFPAVIRLRAVGDHSVDLEARCAAAVVGVAPAALIELDHKLSAQGNFSSVRLQVEVASADQLRLIMASLESVQGVRVVL